MCGCYNILDRLTLGYKAFALRTSEDTLG